MKFNKFLLIGLPIITLIFILSVYFFNPSKDQSENHQNREESKILSEIVFDVVADVAKKGSIVQTISASGVTKSIWQVDITPNINGKVIAVFVEEGSRVNKDKLIVKLDDTEYLIALKEAEAKLIETQIEYNLMKYGASMERIESDSGSNLVTEAIKKFDAAKDAYKANLISEKEYQKAKRDYEAALVYSPDVRDDVIAQKSGLNQSLVSVERAKLNLNYTEIKSPLNGYAADVNVQLGQNVKAGEKLLQLVDVSKLKVEIGVLETEIKLIKKGSNVNIIVSAYPGKTFKGKIENISPIIDTQTKTCKVIVEIDNVEGIIKPGMYANVEIETEVFRDRIIVPKQSILLRDQRKLVFCVKDGFAKWCYVETGAENKNFVEVKEGINVGDTVLVDGHYSLAHDARLRVHKK